MTTGIYALQFNNDLTYIGQSINIEARTKRHLREMVTNHHYNSKLLEAFNLYGGPEISIIEVCNSKDLDYLENIWINEFNSCKNGLNIRDQYESVLRGPNATGAKFSREQILEVFNMLCNGLNTYKYISQQTSVPIGSVNCLSRGNSHLWLKEEFPEQYATMISLKGTRNGKQNTLGNRYGRVFPDLKSPEGIIYSNITNMAQFARDHNLIADYLYNLVGGYCKSVKGWTVA